MADDPVITSWSALRNLRELFNSRWAAAFEKEQARTALLREALVKYGQHTYECATLGKAKSPTNVFPIVDPGPCDCGLDEILEVTKL